MTAKTLDTLKTDISAALPDNVTGDIDPVDVRDTGLIDSIDSLSDRVAITPQMFGALGDADGTTGNGNDDTAAIQLAADFCAGIATANLTPILLFPYASGYRTTGKVTIKENISIIMDAKIFFDGDDTLTCLEIGTASVNNSQVQFRIFAHKITRSLWADGLDDGTDDAQTSIGVKIINVESSLIRIDVRGFTVGMQCIGDDEGVAHNVFDLGRFVDNKIHIDLRGISPNSPTTLGFVNENLFRGGRIANTSGFRKDLSRYGVRIFSPDRLNDNLNGNLFIKPSFEMNGGTTMLTAGECVPVLLISAKHNKFVSCRNENNGVNASHLNFGTELEDVFAKHPLMTPTNLSTFNWFDWKTERAFVQHADVVGVHVETDDQSDYGPLRLAYDSGSIIGNATNYSATETHIPNMHLSQSSGAANFVKLGAFPFGVDEDFTVDTGADEIIDVAHTRRDGDIVFLTTTGSLPNGLDLDTKYFVVNPTTDRFQVSLTLAGTGENIVNAGSGTHTYHGKNRFLDVPSTRGVGFKIHTHRARRFLLATDVDPINPTFNGGRIAIRCFDSEGVMLIDNPADPYVKGALPGDFVFGAGVFGGSYRNGINGDGRDRYFLVRDPVHFVDVLVAGGAEGPAKIERIRVYSMDTDAVPQTFIDYDGGWRDRRLCNTIPAVGVHFVGETAWDFEASAGTPPFFTCSAEGSPGTWLSAANLS